MAVPPVRPSAQSPGRSTCPSVGCQPLMIRASVDFPEPLPPTIATNSAGRIVSDTSRSASRVT